VIFKIPHKLSVLFFTLLGVGLLAVGVRAITLYISKPPSAQLQSFSVAYQDPLTTSGISPADILVIGGSSLISCQTLGLVCGDPASGGPVDDLASLSFGWDFIPMDLPLVQFSVAPGTLGSSGSAVSWESGCSPPEAQADVFESSLDGTNFQDLDGDGQACDPSNAGYGLGLKERPSSDNLDALAQDPCSFIDLDCDSHPDQPLFFTLASGSPSLAYLGATSADILVSGFGYTPLIWANGERDLDLVVGDQIDALCIRENGNGIYDPGDLLLFSLAAGSPTLAAMDFSAADLLTSGKQVTYEASLLGLGSGPGEDLDALTCNFEFEKPSYQVFFPLITR